MASYDTIHLKVPRDSVSDGQVSYLTSKLSGTSYHQDQWGEPTWTGGNLENMKVTISNNSIKFKGSANKFFYGHNLTNIGLHDSCLAFEKLQDESQLILKDAQVTRIDVGHNMKMDYKPELYISYLGDSARYKTVTYDTSKYWKNAQRQTVFYCKGTEMKSASRKMGSTIDPNLIEPNLARLEHRWTKGLNSRFNRNKITIQTLTEPDFYVQIHEMWKAEYEAIQKVHKVDFFSSGISTGKQFFDSMTAHCLIEYMGVDNAGQIINEMNAKGIFKNSSECSRARKRLRELSSSPRLTYEGEMVKELNQKVRMVEPCI